MITKIYTEIIKKLKIMMIIIIILKLQDWKIKQLASQRSDQKCFMILKEGSSELFSKRRS